MNPNNSNRLLLTLGLLGAAVWLLAPAPSRGASRQPGRRVAAAAKATEGTLLSIGKDGLPGPACPLKHTGVQAEIAGSMARVRVVQEFSNPLAETIEAVYIFPLPVSSAVDRMTMVIGDRTIAGKIKRREEARAIYDAARNAGHAAALLDQERPNIFTQSVANIRPGESVKIEISYVETLKYEDGNYEFSFPMVVGPRYLKGSAAVPDAERINPPVMPPDIRAGHDISIEVTLDAGVPLNFLRSLTHDIDVRQAAKSRATVHLREKNAIPNKDFVLTWDVAGQRIADAILTHRGARGGFFSMILQPPDEPRVVDITPKEIVFVLDTSGSMHGFPIEKAKEAMKLALDGMHPRDTFNLITFSGDTHILFPKPVPATSAHLEQAKRFLDTRSGSGGTEMMKAIRAALDPSDSQEHVRIVCFMTDGYVGNDLEIIGEVQRHPNARVFSFGIGSSVNRFLLDKMAEAGRGEVEYVTLEDDGSAAAKRLHERVRSPLLTDVAIDWNGLPVSEVFPSRIPDLFSAKPVVLSGRFHWAARGALRLRGRMAGRAFSRDIPVNFAEADSSHDVLATLWARRKVDALMSQDWTGIQNGALRGDLKEQITQLGLDFNLMTQFTSFVAVEERVVSTGGTPRRIEVPVEMPHGVTFEPAGAGREADVAMKSMANTGGFLGGIRRRADAPMAAAVPLPARQEVRVKAADLKDLDKSSRKIDPALAGRTGELSIRVWLNGTPADALRKLTEAGAVVTATPPGARYVVVKVAADKLERLARLDVVRYLAPEP